MVAVAQLVESRIVIPVVVGSSPISHPIFDKRPTQVGLFICASEDRGTIHISSRAAYRNSSMENFFSITIGRNKA